jgi:TatD DNase family protein
MVERQKLSQHFEFSDAHCHLNLFDDPYGAVEASRMEGVGTVITAGGSAKDNAESIKLLYIDHVFAVVGIGPDFSASDSGHIEELEKLVRSNTKIVGIGEIGMDIKVAGENNVNTQEKVFIRQVQIAKDLELPIVVHSREAIDRISKILVEMQVKRAMFHFFEGNEEQAASLAERGYLISIPPAWTGKRKRIIKEVSLNSIVVETDSPIVGKMPADVIGVCETIAKLKGVSLEEVATKTTENIRRLFYI